MRPSGFFVLALHGAKYRQIAGTEAMSTDLICVGQTGGLGKILNSLITEPDFECLMIDARHCKVHPDTAGAKIVPFGRKCVFIPETLARYATRYGKNTSSFLASFQIKRIFLWAKILWLHPLGSIGIEKFMNDGQGNEGNKSVSAPTHP